MIPPTPLEEAPGSLAGAGRVFLKREDSHELGSFKWRGALPVLEDHLARREGCHYGLDGKSRSRDGLGRAAARARRDCLCPALRLAGEARDRRESRCADPTRWQGPRRRQGRGEGFRAEKRSSLFRGRSRAGPVRGLQRDRGRGSEAMPPPSVRSRRAGRKRRIDRRHRPGHQAAVVTHSRRRRSGQRGSRHGSLLRSGTPGPL